MLQLTCDEEQNLKTFTENRYAQGSFFWSYLLKHKEIKVNGKRTGTDVALHKGDVIAYYLTPKQEAKPAYHLVYEDENVLVVDKESGVNSEAVFSALLRQNPDCRFLHRLDRNTRGLLIFAKNDTAERVLLQAFREHKIQKTYHALCFGQFPKQQDVLVGYLRKDAQASTVRVYDNPVKGSERIITEYQVLEQNEEYTKVQIILHTGKTHQIRAHLAHIDCPVAGDMKYGDNAKNRAKNLTRQCLIAKNLTFYLEKTEMSYLNGKSFASRFEAEL